ncbi:MAG: hypothetical protein JST48_05295 [Bacteroidetes bacterium]|nr:hypothetical protein [Bacteroidota bacterium]
MYKENKLTEGEDFYFENGLIVLTEKYHLKRGSCCQSGCRHCPYGFKKTNEGKEKSKP